MTSIALQSAAASDAPVESLLAPVHARWLEQLRDFVDPATIETAGFWNRWSATRYLGDQFLDHFRLERGLLSSIAHLLDADDAARLIEQAAHLEKVRARIDYLGRQRGTGVAVARDTRELVRALPTWCAEMESAAAGLRRDMMSSQANDLLDHVIASPGLAAR